MRIVIIGSNSFSGASFIASALRDGHEVIGLSRSEEAPAAYTPYRWLPSELQDNFRFQTCDLNRDIEKLQRLIRSERPNAIVNFAAQSMVGQSWDHPSDWFMTNAVTATNLFNMLRQNLDCFDRYLHVTTPEVYGSTQDWIKEGAPFNPSTPYAVSRAAGDLSLKSYMDAFGLPAILTRAANVYGPGQPLYRIIPRALFFFKTGQVLELHGGGHSERSFIHIDDVSRAKLRLLESGTVGETYHISTREMITIRELVEVMAKASGIDFDVCVRVTDERLGKDSSYRLEDSKLRNELDWSDRVGLSEGIQETQNWIERFLDDLKSLPQNYVHKA